ncbi:MAG: FeoA family protein [Verrucomicrobiota bacterium]
MPFNDRPLTLLAVGHTGLITTLGVSGAEKARLQELGLVTGTAIELVRFAPLGDPVEIKVRGSYLTLRKHEADQVMVTPKG